MPELQTTFDLTFAEKENARDALVMLKHFVKIASIPNNATWVVLVRGIGLIVTVKWDFGEPGSIPATEVDHIGGVPVLVGRKNDDEVAPDGE